MIEGKEKIWAELLTRIFAAHFSMIRGEMNIGETKKKVEELLKEYSKRL